MEIFNYPRQKSNLHSRPCNAGKRQTFAAMILKAACSKRVDKVSSKSFFSISGQKGHLKGETATEFLFVCDGKGLTLTSKVVLLSIRSRLLCGMITTMSRLGNPRRPSDTPKKVCTQPNSGGPKLEVPKQCRWREVNQALAQITGMQVHGRPALAWPCWPLHAIEFLCTYSSILSSTSKKDT